jgi:hypothetical protein
MTYSIGVGVITSEDRYSVRHSAGSGESAAPLPVLGPWPALRSGSAWPRFTRLLSQVRTGCCTAEKYSNSPARRLTRAHVGNRAELGTERATLGVPVVRDEEVNG